ncbi:M-phase inducer phosphatase-like isoform X2 [Periplaneta americana]|uniref:M-phase inducer phosphatase-like isoform X2 n=1 Tax=Periplaneta americana TaxID=6978 RepID=UPI0037E92EC9
MLWDTVAIDCCEICQSCSRLLKNSIKLSYSNEGNVSRGRGFSRRLNVNLPASPLNYEKCNTPNNDKENMGFGGSGTPVGVMPEIDVHSFTHHSSPTKQINSPSKFAALRQNSNPLRQRQPLEDQDPNSQDSGYGTFLDKDELKPGFRFVEPSGLAPRRSNSELSPRKEISPEKSPRSIPCGSPRLSLFHSLSSGSESIDDGFTDLLDVDKVEETTHLPSGISSLLSGPIIRDHNTIALSCSPKEEKPRPIFQRSISLVDNLTPASSRARSCLFKPSSSTQNNEEDNSQLVTLENLRSFKRPDPPCEIGPLQPKRRKSSSLHSIRESTLTSNPGILQRSFSETEATIKRALQRSTQIPDLIGDFSKPFVLPLMEGRHQDLKTISADTLASLMNGNFNNEVDSYTIVDCRYPYEYDGGHIRGAKNIYTKEQIYKEFVDTKPSAQNSGLRDPSQKDEASASKRRILIFHCEFSSERGPSLFRFLRNSDRDQNKEFYPALNYPELYLLHGGYKTFFERHSDKCEPCAYRPMLDPNHETDLKHFRSKSKSWNGDSKSRLALRNNLKRLGL